MPFQERAAVLMRVALSILDEGGNSQNAAAHLQAAIDCLAVPPFTTPDEEHSSAGAIAADAPLVRAMGGALAVIATLLKRQRIASVEELSGLLGIYSAITGETENEEGLILAYWAGLLRDVADTLNSKDAT